MRRAALAGLLLAAAPPPAPVRIDQLGFAPGRPIVATVPTAARAPIGWRLRDAGGHVLAAGTTRPFGVDPGSGVPVQEIAAPGVARAGDGYRLTVDGIGDSHPFRVGPARFAPLARAAMGFFYQQRAGVPIRVDLAGRADLARAAGHPHEVATCFSGADALGARWPGCGLRLDVTGGWYDAGDQGKYVVNGGLSAWTLIDLAGRLADWGTPGLLADGTLPIPERRDGIPDVLDEARVEVAFLLAMQVPAGTRLAVSPDAGRRRPVRRFVPIDAGGLVFSKVADVAWTGIPTAPAADPMTRALYPPTTAATLNMVAAAARAARAFAAIDPRFAARALAAAKAGWRAAERHPALLASSDFVGSGGYGDAGLDDERLWAAAELLAAIGGRAYARAVAVSPLLDQPGDDLDWGHVALAADMTLATAGARVPPAIRRRAAAALARRADALVAERAGSGYGIPFSGRDFVWGSNAMLLNRAMVLGVAWQVARRPAYRDAALGVMDYLLGRNPLDRSYVTGFGARPPLQPHHRFWAHAADPRFPPPPPGVLSGGPNSLQRDEPAAARLVAGCVGATCWADDWRAFTMNEVAINWNAPLAWVASFLAATDQGKRAAAQSGDPSPAAARSPAGPIAR